MTNETFTPWEPLELAPGAWFVVRHEFENASWARTFALTHPNGPAYQFHTAGPAMSLADRLNEPQPPDEALAAIMAASDEEILAEAQPGEAEEVKAVLDEALANADRALAELCSDCPPPGYPTEETRCLPCPRRQRRYRESDAPSSTERLGPWD